MSNGDNSKEKLTPLEKIRQQAALAGSQLPRAIVSAWFYTLVGLTFGFAFLGLNKLLILWSENTGERFAGALLLVAFVFEHLGIGLIVAAIAVFFYEWGAAIKETMELAARLTRSIDQIEGTRTIVEMGTEVSASLEQTKRLMESLCLTERLYKDLDKATRFNLRVCLNETIGGPSKPRSEQLEQAIVSCERLVLAIKKLREDGAWGNHKYIEFITKHISEVVGLNANALSHLKRNGNKQDFTVPPTAAGMAVQILSKQMEAMEEGDCYDVVSDITSWRDQQLDELFGTTEIAIKESEVEVRRVFNFLPYILRKPFRRDLPEGYQGILAKHLSASEDWKGDDGKGNYKIKILWRDGYEGLRKNPWWKNIDIEKLHFGLFAHQKESVRFSVTKPDLSDIEMRRQDRDNEFAKIFTGLWNEAKEFPEGSSVDDRISKVCKRLSREME